MTTVQTRVMPVPDRVDLILDQLDQLPTLPTVAALVVQMTRRDDTSARDVVQVIASDQSLSAKILRLAARAHLGAPRDVDTIEKAVVLLGFEAVRHAVLSIKVFETLNTVGTDWTGKFDRAGFWRHSLAVACASHLIAERWPGHLDAEVAFVCGLLHDIGKVALDACLPKSYDRVVSVALSRRIGIINVEQELLGVDHTVAGKRLAQHWRLPASIVECIWLHHHTPDLLPDCVSNPDLVQIVNLADNWVREQRLGFSGTPPEPPSSVEIAAQMGMPARLLEEIAPLLIERIEQRAELLGLDRVAPGAIFAETIAGVNGELQRMHEQLAGVQTEMRMRSRYVDLLHRFNSAVHSHLTVADCCQIGAACFREMVCRPAVVVFSCRSESHIYHVGVSTERGCSTRVFAAEHPTNGSVSAAGAVLGPGVMAAPPIATPVRERLAEELGPAPHWMLPIAKDGKLLGGVLFQATTHECERLRQDHNELVMFATVLANVLINGYDRLASEGLSEGLAEINRELKAAQSELLRARSLGMVAEMAGGAAHELNNPLAVISGRAELLLQNAADPKLKKDLNTVMEQAQRCSDIVGALMDFAKPEPPQKQALDLAELLRGCLREWMEQRPAPAEQVHLGISDQPLVVQADAAQIRGALTEVLHNAWEACEAGKAQITVNCEADPTDEIAIVTVQDNGCGMTPDVLAKAQDPFFSYKKAGRGRGLGLSRAVRWCDINGGKLRIESQPGSGTQVRIEFRLNR